MNEWKYKDFVVLVVLTLGAALVRLVLLEHIPIGLHGDEAWNGLDARRIYSSGYVGVYTGGMLGHPILPLYWTALVFKIFGESIYTLRASIAFFGIITISLFYVLARMFFDRISAVLATLAFSFSLFHIHFSRTAFLLVTAPVFQTISLIFIFLAVSSNKIRYLVAGGAAAGLGVYSYNAFILFPLTVFTYFPLSAKKKMARNSHLKNLMAFIGTAGIVTMILFFTDNIDFIDIIARHASASLIIDADTSSIVSMSQMLRAVLDNTLSNSVIFFRGGEVDTIDSFGQYYTFLPVTLSLFISGIYISLRGKRREFFFMTASMAILFVGLIVTHGAVYRRHILLLVYMYFHVGLSTQTLIYYLPIRWKALGVGAVTFLILIEGLLNLSTYFGLYAKDVSTRYLFAHDLRVVASQIKKYVPDDRTVLFFSDGYPCNFETARFIHPNLVCIDQIDHEGNYIQNIPSNTPLAVVLVRQFADLEEKFAAYYSEYTAIYLREDSHIIAVIIIPEDANFSVK